MPRENSERTVQNLVLDFLQLVGLLMLTFGLRPTLGYLRGYWAADAAKCLATRIQGQHGHHRRKVTGFSGHRIAIFSGRAPRLLRPSQRPILRFTCSRCRQVSRRDFVWETPPRGGQKKPD